MIDRDGVGAGAARDGQGGRGPRERHALDGAGRAPDAEIRGGGRIDLEDELIVAGAAVDDQVARGTREGDRLEAGVPKGGAIQIDGAGIGACRHEHRRVVSAVRDDEGVEAPAPAVDPPADASTQGDDERVVVAPGADQVLDARERDAAERPRVGARDSPRAPDGRTDERVESGAAGERDRNRVGESLEARLDSQDVGPV